MLRSIAIICVANLLLSSSAIASAGDASREYIDLSSLHTIIVHPGADRNVLSIARLLKSKLHQYYRIEARIEQRKPGILERGIIIGRKAAVLSGGVTKDELDKLKYDGYFIKAEPARITLAGYAAQGTIYAGYDLLRRIGIKVYPWHYSDDYEVFHPLQEHKLQVFTIHRKPFFDHRDLFVNRDRGQFGGTIRQYSLGDLRFAHDLPEFKDRGWLGWDHTAAYLVPPAIHKGRHPEYYTKREWHESLEPVKNLRVTLCTCNEEVADIAAINAINWINKQPQRRYFAITNGDTQDACQVCAAKAPVPDYSTDHLLDWVNAVARKVSIKHPDKKLFTLAYLNTVKPPVRSKLEGNVIVVYAPWYWTSRATSAVSLDHPLNITAMDEFRGWTSKYPGQIGVYDYPGDWVYGTAERVKLYAKHGVKWVYFNGAKSNRLQWIISHLLWDPEADINKLDNEFVEVFYGPAADAMSRYLGLLKQTIETDSHISKYLLNDPRFLEQASYLLKQAENVAMRSQLEEQTRILDGVRENWYKILRTIKPDRANVSVLNRHLDEYIQLSEKIIHNARSLRHKDRYIKSRKKLLKRQTASLRKKYESPQLSYSNSTPLGIKLSDYDAGDWHIESTKSNLVADPDYVSHDNHSGSILNGIRFKLPLTKMPLIKRGGIDVHGGRFFIEKKFDSPIDMKGRFHLDIHVHTSHEVPVTIYLNRDDKLRSDVKLVAGEQVVRIDLRNFDGKRFSLDDWDWLLKDIAVDVWPQDMLYPHTGIADIELTLFDISIGNGSIWDSELYADYPRLKTSYSRPNIPFGENMIRELSVSLASKASETDGISLDGEYTSRRITESFRSFTDFRVRTE